MPRLTTIDKLAILADAAKYDASCASSGSRRRNSKRTLGHSAPSGICHSYTEDGRCVSLLKILYTNVCIYDCAYCINRSSNDIPRAAFTAREIVDLTNGHGLDSPDTTRTSGGCSTFFGNPFPSLAVTSPPVPVQLTKW